MIIDYELQGRSFFHSDCDKIHGGGIVKPIKDEEGKTLCECVHCSKKGYYPVGKIGAVKVEEVL